MELDNTTYKLTRKLYAVSRQLIRGATLSSVKGKATVREEDLELLKDTLTELKNAKKD